MVVTIALSPAVFDAQVKVQYYMLQDVAAQRKRLYSLSTISSIDGGEGWG